MNTFTPGQSPDDIKQKLTENLAEQLIPLLDMTDQKTSDFYWAFVMLQAAGLAAQLKRAFELNLMKPSQPAAAPAAP